MINFSLAIPFIGLHEFKPSSSCSFNIKYLVETCLVQGFLDNNFFSCFNIIWLQCTVLSIVDALFFMQAMVFWAFEWKYSWVELNKSRNTFIKSSPLAQEFKSLFVSSIVPYLHGDNISFSFCFDETEVHWDWSILIFTYEFFQHFSVFFADHYRWNSNISTWSIVSHYGVGWVLIFFIVHNNGNICSIVFSMSYFVYKEAVSSNNY